MILEILDIGLPLSLKLMSHIVIVYILVPISSSEMYLHLKHTEERCIPSLYNFYS